MRILYGVHGYGRGHATRTAAVLPYLARDYQLLVVAGGDAFPSLWPEFPVIRIPTFGFAYGRKGGRRSTWQTLRRNISGILDLKLRGPVFDMVREVVEDFAPDVILSDAEAWTHHVAAHLNIPRISFDHIGILAYCRTPIEWADRLEALIDTTCYKILTGQPDRVIVSSFYPVPPKSTNVAFVGPLPRQAVRELTPTAGEHLLVYFNRGDDQLNPMILEALAGAGCPVRVYGSSRRGRQGPITFLPTSNLPFLEDLASCRAVLSTAGNQLVGEAIYLGKPVLVMPERCVEQRLNAAAVERLGIGMRIRPRELAAHRIRDFLDRGAEYSRAIRANVRDGLKEALAAIDRFIHELVPAARPAVASRPAFAPLLHGAP
jgi:uncharacterized protein (TIGR00661 family)